MKKFLSGWHQTRRQTHETVPFMHRIASQLSVVRLRLRLRSSELLIQIGLLHADRLWIVADLILLAIPVTAARNLFQKAAQLFQNVTFQLFKFSKKFHPNYHVLSKPGLLFFFTQKKMTKLSTSHIFRLIIILWVLSAAAAVPFAVFTKVNYFR